MSVSCVATGKPVRPYTDCGRVFRQAEVRHKHTGGKLWLEVSSQHTLCCVHVQVTHRSTWQEKNKPNQNKAAQAFLSAFRRWSKGTRQVTLHWSAVWQRIGKHPRETFPPFTLLSFEWQWISKFYTTVYFEHFLLQSVSSYHVYLCSLRSSLLEKRPIHRGKLFCHYQTKAS